MKQPEKPEEITLQRRCPEQKNKIVNKANSSQVSPASGVSTIVKCDFIGSYIRIRTLFWQALTHSRGPLGNILPHDPGLHDFRNNLLCGKDIGIRTPDREEEPGWLISHRILLHLVAQAWRTRTASCTMPSLNSQKCLSTRNKRRPFVSTRYAMLRRFFDGPPSFPPDLIS